MTDNIFSDRFKTFFEMMPLNAFLLTYYNSSKNLFITVGVCIIFSWIQLLCCKLKFNKIRKNTWLSTILVTIFGGLIIILHYKPFIILKPIVFAVLFCLLGLSMLIGQVLYKASVRNTFWVVSGAIIITLIFFINFMN